MARASTQRKRRARPPAQQRAAQAEDLMFFPKLRRRAKWVFLFLAIAFAGSFIFFGVGAGGSGIGDYLSDLFNRQPATGAPSLGSAQEAVADNPNDAEAQLNLARAAQAEGDVPLAVTAYENYRTMRPQDADAMRALAALYGRQISEAQQRAQVASIQAAEANLPNTLAPADSELLQEITGNRLTEAVSAQAEARASTANAEVQRLSLLQLGVFEELTLLVDDDPLLWLQFAGAAETSQNYESAVTAYEKYLDLQPNSPQAEQIRQRIDALEALVPAGGSSGE
jgi:tetratricopeptide (TPR) repeat protein